MRLFTAIELDEDAREHMARLVRRLVSWGLNDLKYVRPENLHVTLKFLGEVPEAKVGELTALLASVSAMPTELFASSIICLPPRRPVRVIAAGLGGDEGRLNLLFRAIEDGCAPLGFRKETRPYRAHVTLARARDPLPASARDSLRELLESQVPGPRFRPAHFTLFKSELQRAGPQYTPLARFPLASR